MSERWLPVVGHEDRYEVSDLGHVRSLRTRGGRQQVRVLSGNYATDACPTHRPAPAPTHLKRSTR